MELLDIQQKYNPSRLVKYLYFFEKNPNLDATITPVFLIPKISMK